MVAKRDTRERIVGAAVRLFNEWGTAAVSTNHIAEEAGISPGNLYYHFRNKEEIIRAIFGRMMVSWEETFALPRDRAPTLPDLRVILESTFSVVWEYRFFYREFVALLRRDPELGGRYRVVREQGLTNTEALLEGFFEGGILRNPEDPSVAPRLAKIFWLIAEFWLPFVEMGEERVGLERSQEGIELMTQILSPFMVDVAPAGAGQDVQDIRTRGGES